MAMLTAYVVALCVPNVALCVTEQLQLTAALTNVLLPAGIYLMVLSLSSNAGKTILALFPAAFLAAFQIVLFFLYGGSIIGVDMFLNVLTTSSTEVAELLGNLLPALGVVFVLYLPPLIWAAVNLRRKRLLHQLTRRRVSKCGLALTTAGLLTLAVSYAWVPRYAIGRDLFPVNVVKNWIIAIDRVEQNRNYPTTSSGFTFEATSERPDSLRELYVIVIGETGRADNYGLLGYSRPTTPLLSATDGVVAYSHVLSESNTTHKSVPMLLSLIQADNYADINRQRSIITAFREAGFFTAYISTQPLNHSYIDYFGSEAHYVNFLNAERSGADVLKDDALIDELSVALSRSTARKQAVFIHTYGSHFSYSDRYPRSFARYLPDNTADASARNRASLVNAYDNSILHTDFILHSFISRLQKENTVCAMLYVCDHGEDIFDDSRRRFLHASPTPTYWQLHVPLILWASEQWRSSFPHQWAALAGRAAAQVSSSRSFAPTVLQMAGVTSPRLQPGASLADSAYTAPARSYVSDRNECLPLNSCGLRRQDMLQIKLSGIKIN